MFDWISSTMSAFERVQQATYEATTRSLELSAYTAARLMGRSAEEVIPDDRRFQDDVWRENLTADLAKQAYLITAKWMKDMADGLEGVDPALHHQAKFWTSQFVDAISPTNFPLTNPTILQEAVRTGGKSLTQGIYNLMNDALDGRVTQVPPDSFEVGRDLAATPGKVIYRNPLIEIMQYEPATEKVYSIPVLVIPPWVNKYYVMDMQSDDSMYKFLVDSGFTVFTISWKNPDKSTVHLEWDDYVEMGVIEALKVVKAITGSKKVNTIGYCLGGLLEETALAYLAAQGDNTVHSGTYFTTHQDFTDVGDIAVFLTEPWIVFMEWLMDVSGGYLDGRRMALTFNMLRANDLFWRYFVDNYLLGKEPPPFALLYWNSDGTRVSAKLHSYIIRNFFQKNKMMKPNSLEVKGVRIDPGKVSIPSYVVNASWDHIVPWKGAFKIREMLGGPVRYVLTEGGHIAGIINPPTRKRKRTYWTNDGDETYDPEAWMAGATATQESWWLDWARWLKRRSGRKVTPPTMGNETYPPIMDAPGSYVIEK